MEEKEVKHHHLKFSDLFRLSLRVFRTNTSRTFLTILGMAVGIGAVLFLISLGYGLQYILIGKLVTTEDSLISLEAFYPSESDLVLKREQLNEISNLPEAEEISPMVEVSGEIRIDELSGYVLAKIIEPNYFRLSGQMPDIGKVFGPKENSLVISNTALRLIGLKEDESSLGEVLFLKIVYQENEAEAEMIEIPQALTIKGIIVDEYSPPFVFLPAETIPKGPPSFSRVFVKAKDIESVEVLRDKLIEKGLLISARLDLVQQAKRIMTIITVVLGTFGVTALVVAAIGMFNTMVIGFLERIFEVGIMKSIGATSVDVRNLFLMESLMIGFLGGVGGISLGILGGETVNFGLNIVAKQLGGETVKLFIYPWQFLVLIIVVSILVGAISGLWPARRAARLSPKEAFMRK
jgi:ABC-type antimicrobial peptide transport system permease subunit